MSKPLVSVITPAYNAEKYIGEAIKSVQAQTHKDWELIIVDDGSTDKTAEVVRRYVAKDARITLIQQENKKMASARNTGIRAAKGKYIAFLDADNIFFPGKLESQVGHLEADPSRDVSYGDIRHFFGADRSAQYKSASEHVLGDGDQFRELLWRNSINVLSVLIRKSAFDRWGLFVEGWHACDEHYVWLNFAYHGIKFCHHPELVGLLRLHGSNDSRLPDFLVRTAKNFAIMLDAVESWMSDADKKKYAPDIVALRRRWRIRGLIGAAMLIPVLGAVFVRILELRRDKQYTRVTDIS
jgi:glycosyltransferase involved in cell wall biosynthesis